MMGMMGGMQGMNPMAMMANMASMMGNMGNTGVAVSDQAPVDPRVRALCKEFSIDARICNTLNDVMKSREDYDDDIQALHQLVLRAVNKGKKPLDVMLSQIRAIKAGRFAGKEVLDKDIWAFVEKYDLDDRVLGRLINTLNARPKAKKDDLKALDERLA